MIDSLVKYFEKHVELDTVEVEFLQEHVPLRQLAKGDLLLEEGDISTEFYFVIQGGIRLFYHSSSGEKTAFFYFENSFVSAYESFIKQTPSRQNLQAIEDSVVAVIPFEAAYKIVDIFPKFEFLARVMMEEELMVYQDIISSFVTLNAEQRYENLLKNNPQVIQRIPQHQLATYLGIAPETLSRIRKRLVTLLS
jgi:CRP-like cAMP-binding protein